MPGLRREGLRVLDGQDADEDTTRSTSLELDAAISLGEEREIPTAADVLARMHLVPDLTDQDGTSGDQLTIEALHASTLSGCVTAITGAALTFLMCHGRYLRALRDKNVADDDLGERLAVANLATIAVAPGKLHDQHLLVATLVDDLCDHFRASNYRSSEYHLVVLADHEHVGNLDLVANLAVKALDLEGIAHLGSMLVPTQLEYSVHKEPPAKQSIRRGMLADEREKSRQFFGFRLELGEGGLWKPTIRLTVRALQ